MIRRRGLWEDVYTQLCIDFNTETREMVREEVHISEYKEHSERRQYHEKPYPLRGIALPGGGVLSVVSSMKKDFEREFSGKDSNFILEMESVFEIQKILSKHGNILVETHHVYLPDKEAKEVTKGLELRWIEKNDLFQFKEQNKFPNALAFNPMYEDQYAVAAIEKGEIVGLAGVSADCEKLWQIGVDVVPSAKGRRIATSLVSALRTRVEGEGKIPFYGTCSSHIISQKIAISAGFSPAWVEIYAQPQVKKSSDIAALLQETI